MEIIIPTPRDFEFASATSTPFASAPSTPRRFGADFYFSAPTSPTHLSEFYREFDNFSPWEGEDDGTPKLPNGGSGFEDDFAFDFSQDLENKTLPAEVLFDGGKIRKSDESFCAPSSPISRIRQALSPRKKKQIDPLVSDHKRERGRGTSPTNSLPSSSSRRARSVSPHRVSEHPWEGKHEHHHNQQQEQEQKETSIIPKSSLTATKSTLSKGSSSRKWRLKDLFLFRSASEGRGTEKDPFKKYTDLFKKHEDTRNSSFRSTEGYSNSGSTGSSRRRGPISAHELHYTVNRAVSEDLKKKTFLPYKQGILGRLAFNPTVHALANGFGFSRK